MFLRSTPVGACAALLTATVLLAACVASAPSPPTPVATTRPTNGPRFWDAADEEYAIYRAVILHLYAEEISAGGRGPKVEVSDRTTDWRLFGGDPRVSEGEDVITSDTPPNTLGANVEKGITEELVAALGEANRKPARLDVRRLELPGIRLAPLSLSPSRWVPYGRNNTLLLSRVGFSMAGDQALVCVDQWSLGMAYALRKQRDKWQVVGKTMTWIS